ncbi:MAG: hypothetical protein JWO97_122 [Acidobacteria bacterium]|nr:hypothetical protein [Acidobacteriota bacterium]
MFQRITSAATFIAVSLFSTAVIAQVQHIPNTIKYKDTGVKNATGRSGSASIEARALRAKDGNVALDVTTGSFDGGTAAGNIEKLQVKVAGATSNFNQLSGSTVSVPLGTLPWHEPLQLQTNVSGIDGSRTDIVSANEIVKLRPDLAVGSVSGAKDALTGVPITFMAPVSERNGDVGARANCTLSVDGTQVDRAPGIWVDAKGSVTCTFGYTFTSAGTKNVTISVTDVAPGDYDLLNNSTSATVRVYDSADEMDEYYAEADQVVFDDAFEQTGPTRHELSTYKGFEGGAVFMAWIKQPMNFQSSSMHVKETSDGNLVSDFSAAFTSFRPDGMTSGWCSSAFSKDGTLFFDACQRDPIGVPYTRIGWMRYSGDVTYHSEGWATQYTWDNPDGSYYTWNQDSRNTYGPQAHLGSQVSLDVTFGDGEKLWRAQPEIALQQSARVSRDEMCDPAPWDTCYVYTYNQQWKRGEIGGFLPLP